MGHYHIPGSVSLASVPLIDADGYREKTKRITSVPDFQPHNLWGRSSEETDDALQHLENTFCLKNLNPKTEKLVGDRDQSLPKNAETSKESNYSGPEKGSRQQNTVPKKAKREVIENMLPTIRANEEVVTKEVPAVEMAQRLQKLVPVRSQSTNLSKISDSSVHRSATLGVPPKSSAFVTPVVSISPRTNQSDTKTTNQTLSEPHVPPSRSFPFVSPSSEPPRQSLPSGLPSLQPSNRPCSPDPDHQTSNEQEVVVTEATLHNGVPKDRPAEPALRKRHSTPKDGSFLLETKEQLVQVMRHRGHESLNYLESLYGLDPIDYLCRLLKSSPTQGLSSEEDFSSRRQIFGTNEIPQKKPETFLALLFDALKDVTLIILMTAALISLLLSFYENDTPENSSPKDDDDSVDSVESVESFSVYNIAPSSGDDMESRSNWIEAVAIMGTVLLVAFVTAINNYQKERQFRRLQGKIQAEQHFTVLRNGALDNIPVKEILVGDICQLKYGDIIPADGVVVQSNDLKVDESSLTGESELVKKSINGDPSLLSGTQVMEGSGRIIIVAVGLNSQTGIICNLLGITAASQNGKRKQAFVNFWKRVTHIFKREENAEEEEEDGENAETGLDMGNAIMAISSHLDMGLSRSPLQVKLAKLSIKIGYIGLVAAVLTSVVLTLRFCIETFLFRGESWSARYIQVFVRFIILGVTVIVVSVPEGLPLAVTLALAYSVRKMMRDHNLVRHIDACETMGNATAVCCDKTGTLTTNKMSVVDAFVAGKRITLKNCSEKHLLANVSDLVTESICVNTAKTSMVHPNFEGGLPTYMGNRTECALLAFVLRIAEPRPGCENPISMIRARFPEDSIVRVFTFNSTRKSMSTAVRLQDGQTVRLFVKGASEVLLEKCKFLIAGKNAKVKLFNEEEVAEMNESVIQPMACSGLRTVCVAYRDFTQAEASTMNWDDEENIVSSLTCIGIFGIADPVRPEVPEAIRRCQRAGVVVRMVTGDNIDTARAIARICGIIPENDEESDILVLEGKEFNKLIRNPKTKAIEQNRCDEILPRLRVLARSTPEDKYNLVNGIIGCQVNPTGEIVAVTGDGTNDAPALKSADVGFAMGMAGTDVAKEASDIILTDDNFASLVKALMWGRNVYDSIAKFIQFQLTVNIVASLVTVIAAATLEDAVVTPIQMLFVNLLMDSLASLALSTEPPSSRLLDRPPYGRSRPLISPTMAKNICLNSFYQLTVLLAITFFGEHLFSIESGREQSQISSTASAPTQHYTAIYNVFVLMILFSEIGARRLHNERDVFGGLHKSTIFLFIWFGSFFTQILIVEFGGLIFRTTPLALDQWLWCIFFGVGQLIWGQLVSTIPLENCACFKRYADMPPPTVV